MCEPHHAKTGLNICFVLIPKEGLAGTNAAKTSLGKTSILEFCLHRLYFVVDVIPRGQLSFGVTTLLKDPLRPALA